MRAKSQDQGEFVPTGFNQAVVREAIRQAIRSIEPQVLRHCAELELLEEETLP